ncbi:hypothetical protein COOONC_13181 [Cooperia oncophora]
MHSSSDDLQCHLFSFRTTATVQPTFAQVKDSNFSRVKLINEYANLPSNNSKIAKDVDEIIEFETKIAKIMVAEEDRKNPSRMYNLRRLTDMEKLTPMVGRLLFLSCYP